MNKKRIKRLKRNCYLTQFEQKTVRKQTEKQL